MNNFMFFWVLFVAYLIGSVPFGLLAVRLRTGKDIRKIGSGRTGTTNALRAAGPTIAIITLLLDILKGASAVWLAREIVPGNLWLEVIAPLVAILGHNYSIFLIGYDENGRLRLRGGAGGATALGGALGLYPASILVLVPVSILVYFGIGYASVTTMGVPLIAAVIFGIRAWMGLTPWTYVVYLLIVEVIVLWALRPNIRSLLDGTERGVGWRAKKAKDANKESHTEFN